jgi:integrase
MAELPSGSWRATLHLGVDANGKKIRETATFPLKADAQAWLRARQSEIDKAPAGHQATATLTLAEWFDRWHTGRKEGVSARSTHDNEWRWGKHVGPHLGAVPLRKLTPVIIADWLAKLREAGASTDTRKKSGALLRSMLNGAVSAGLLAASPMKGIRLPKVVRPEKVALTREQVLAVIEAAELRYRPLFLLWFDAGLRPGELFALEWDDVRLDAGEVYVRRALDDVSRTIKETKTQKGRRLLAISAETQAALAAVKPAQAAGLVFPSPRTANPWHGSNFRRNVFAPTIKRAGVKCRPYDVRHTTATLLISAGVSIKVVSERLGHEDVQTTLRHYAHVMPGQQAAAAAVMGKIFSTTR